MILQQHLVQKSVWHMLVGCILLNRTTREQADSVWPELFVMFSSPWQMVCASPDDIEKMRRLLVPLGMVNKRLTTLRRMSVDYIEQLAWAGGNHADINVQKLYGCGKYAHDSFQIFVLGERDPLVVEPEDKELVAFLASHGGKRFKK